MEVYTSLILPSNIGKILSEVHHTFTDVPDEITLRWYYAIHELVSLLLQRNKLYSSSTHYIKNISLLNSSESNVEFTSTNKHSSHTIRICSITTSRKQAKVSLLIY
jgi:hypothetical protein